MILKWFCPSMCIVIDLSLAVFWKSYLSLHDFWFKKAKINFLKKLSVLCAVFIEFKYRWLQTCLVDLKKHQTLNILLMTDFLCIFKNWYFSEFSEIFGHHQLLILKSLFVFYFMLNCLTKHHATWWAHFLTILFTNLVSTSEFNVKL